MSVRDVQTGTVIDGRYRIKHRIGSGGMADVYCAIDEQLGRDVALKLLHRRFAEDRAGASDMPQTGSIMGTAQYLSPGQAQGLPVDERSDLYSVGVVLYEMLTGRVPFTGDSAVSIALKQVAEAPAPPRSINPAIPPELEGIVLRALEKDPARRFQDADEFITALDRVRGHLAAGAAPIGEPTPAFAT